MIIGLALLDYVFMSTPEKVDSDHLMILSVGTYAELLTELLLVVTMLHEYWNLVL